ncbi:titin-like isoform X1 [Cynara cardunculus var. scolymus]|uniref:titin-like isoform X1 n=1 Tax=Cynara cardunculus var. scolymus TaxID=59895 RepID=UPI000D62E3E6|nr:titin-like isoform X1 [Cynara cardunculus var. scolymus]
MGRPPSNGGPSFRFNQAEIAEMEAILQAHKTAMPVREVLVSLAEKFSNSEERSGKIEVQMKQVWNWFQNRRYAIRAKAAKSPGKLNVTQMTRDDSAMVKGVPQATQPHGASSATVRSLPQAPQHPTGPSAVVRSFQQAPQHPAAFSVQSAGRVADNSQMEYEAKSARDGAWYDVSTFLSHRSLETGDPEVLVRFAGFGAEEDEWVIVRKNVRQRSLPCESSECVAVLPADLILCFQEGKEQALYFDAHVLDAQRRRHDVRGCRCRFLVRYDHDQSEEIVALRKICRRPETDYRLQQLHAVNESLSANQNKNGANNIHTVSTLRVYPPAEVQQKQHKVEPVVPSLSAEVPQKRQKVESTFPAPPPDGSQKHFKVEPAMVALSGVPQNQQRVQPAPPPRPPSEAPLYPNKVEPVLCLPSDQALVEPHRVEPVVPCPSAQPSLEPNKVESVVPVPSAQDSAETQVAIMPTCSEKVPLELHQVQPVMHGPSTELSPTVVAPVEPKVAESLKESMVSGTSVEVPSELEPADDVSVVAQMETKIAEPQKEEPVVAVQVPSELHEIQPMLSGLSTQVSVAAPLEPKVAEPQKEELVSEVPSELHQVQPMMPGPLTEQVSIVAPKIVEPQKEPMTPGDSIEVGSELHKVQPMMPVPLTQVLLAVAPMEANVGEPQKEEPLELRQVQPDELHTSVLEAIETKPEESVTTVEEIETKAEEPVNSGNVIEQPKLAEVMEGNVDDEEHAKDAENGNINEVGDPELQVENAGTVEMEEG